MYETNKFQKIEIFWANNYVRIFSLFFISSFVVTIVFALSLFILFQASVAIRLLSFFGPIIAKTFLFTAIGIVLFHNFNYIHFRSLQ